MSEAIAGGTTDVSTRVRIVDSSDGTPEEGVTSATAGLNLWYRREGATKVDFSSIGDLATLDAAHSDEDILHIDDGYYRVDVPDAAFAAGVRGVLIGGTATGMVVIGAFHPIDEPADVIAFSGDKDAADNFETMLDGTGGQTLSLGQLVITASAATGAVEITNDSGPGIHIDQTDQICIHAETTGEHAIEAVSYTHLRAHET